MNITWELDDYANGGKAMCRFGAYEAWQLQSGVAFVEFPSREDAEAAEVARALLDLHKKTGKIWTGEPELASATCHCGERL